MQLHRELEKRLTAKFTCALVSVEVQGASATLKLISNDFNNLTPVKRQRLVYSVISDLIQSGELHAVTIDTKTPDEAAEKT